MGIKLYIIVVSEDSDDDIINCIIEQKENPICCINSIFLGLNVELFYNLYRLPQVTLIAIISIKFNTDVTTNNSSSAFISYPYYIAIIYNTNHFNNLRN